MFVFEIGTLPFLERQRSNDYRYAEQERFGAPAATQFLGPGEDKITLTGALLPELAGKFSAIETLRDMAKKGEAYTLMDGTGNIIGDYTIRSLSETQSEFFVDGVARKGSFTIELKRAEDPQEEATASEQ